MLFSRGCTSFPYFWAIFFSFAFFIRVGIVFSPLAVTTLNGDEKAYVTGANAILNAGEYKTDAFYAFRPPAFSIMLATMKSVGAGKIQYVHILNALVSFMTLLFFFFLLRQLNLSQTSFRFAMILFAIYPASLGEIIWLTPDIIYIALMTAQAYYLMNGKFITAGCIAGIMTWFRPEALALYFFVVAVRILWHPQNFQKIALSSLMALAIISPWLIRNTVVIGRPYLSTNFALNFWLGNAPQSTGTSAFAASNLSESEIHAGIQLATNALRNGGEQAFVETLMKLSLDHISAEPLDFLSKIPKKLFFLWKPETDYYPWAIDAGRMPDLGAGFRTSLDFAIVTFWALMMFFAAIGFFVKAEATFYCRNAVIGLSLMVMPLVGESRYHLFVQPFLLTLSAIGIEKTMDRLRSLPIRM